MIEELEEKPLEKEEEEEIDDDEFISSFPPVQYSYTFCDVAFLLHKLNQLAKRKQKENIKKKESCKSPDESMESFCVDFARLSALNLISAKFVEAMKNSLEAQAKAAHCTFLVKTFLRNSLPALSITWCALIMFPSSATRVTSVNTLSAIRSLSVEEQPSSNPECDKYT